MMRTTVLILLGVAPVLFAADFPVAPGANASAAIEAARDAARKAAGGPHRIVLAPGDYFLAKTVEFDARDNGLTLEAAQPGKTTLYGGRLVTGWRRDGDRFWTADIEGVKDGKWDFRALVVNGRMPERARLPESGVFLHRSKFDVPWLSSVGGGWARKPTPVELTTMEYDPKDLPATLEVRNAEVRVYHMWDESLVGTIANDVEKHVLTFGTPMISPAGAFGVKKYVVFNTREGMTRPGQWYLERAAGRVVYWPLAGEDMTRAKVIAPVLERVIGIVGNSKAPAVGITLRGVSIQATTTPLKPAGFGAGSYDGALRVEWARDSVFEKLEIANVGGQAFQSRELTNCKLRDSHIHHAGACGVRIAGRDSALERSHVHHVGVYHPSAVAVWAMHDLRPGDEKGIHVYRNEVHDTPYSGIIGGGGGHLIEENLIYRVMRELHDGGAIYGGIKKSILRGNVVRDVVKMGEGYGVSSYYLDEGAQDCIVERNVSIGVERPTHNHITRDILIRDNVFIAESDMTLSFQRSGGTTFTGNTLFVPGKINIVQPSSIKTWSNNIVYRNGTDKDGKPQAFTIDSTMPPSTPPARRTWAYPVERVAQAPTLDGEIGWEEWPRTMLAIDRDQSRWNAAGAPAFAKVGYDADNLYVAVNVAVFEAAKMLKGSGWRTDEGIEIAIAGAGGTYIVRGFADGTVKSGSEGGASVDATKVKLAVKTFGTRMGGWRAEFAIPFALVGVKPAPGVKIPFNIAVYRAEDGALRMLEGTLAESWKLDQAATLQLK